MRRLLPLLLVLLLANPPASSDHVGFASAYAPGVMEATVEARWANDWWRVDPPRDWYIVHGYVAAMDCSWVGRVGTLTAGGRNYRVLIADCAGDDGPIDRFAKLGIVAELDASLWAKLTEQHGRPLRVRLSP